MLVLVGLGNPGPEFARNRHNLGSMAVEAIGQRWRFERERSRHSALTREGTIETAHGPVRTLLLRPRTYYNESGQSVAEAVKFFRLAPSDVVVFYDEIDLAPGRFRMKTGGGAAGNNGVRSIVARIGPEFRRARLGTGHPGHKDLVTGHVLSNFHKSEVEWAARLLAACAEAVPLLASGEDERYQAEVMRLAPADKLDPRSGDDDP